MKKKSSKCFADPKLVCAEVNRILDSVPDVTLVGRLGKIEWNDEFLDVTKAKLFEESYAVMMRKCHILGASPVTFQALQSIAKFSSDRHRSESNLPASTPDRFVAHFGVENSRKQGVGAIIDTQRFEVTAAGEIPATKKVSGIPPLRGTFVIEGTDKMTKKRQRIEIPYWKPMRGRRKLADPTAL
jgi:hypothetical protein